jgi:hypothetical protein
MEATVQTTAETRLNIIHRILNNLTYTDADAMREIRRVLYGMKPLTSPQAGDHQKDDSESKSPDFPPPLDP